MKKLLLLFVGLAVFTSCEKEPETEQPNEEPEYDVSLAGTTWEGVRWLYPNPGRSSKMELKMVFTSTTVDFSSADYPLGGNPDVINWGFTGTYTYDPPTVTITVTSPEHLKGLVNTGTVNGKNMVIRIHRTSDQIDRYIVGLP